MGLILGPSLKAVICRSRRARILILVAAARRQARSSGQHRGDQQAPHYGKMENVSVEFKDDTYGVTV